MNNIWPPPALTMGTKLSKVLHIIKISNGWMEEYGFVTHEHCMKSNSHWTLCFIAAWPHAFFYSWSVACLGFTTLELSSCDRNYMTHEHKLFANPY